MKSSDSASWTHLSDEELLKKRLRDLSLKIEESELEPCIQELYKNLESKNLLLKPTCYLADEWFVLEKETNIGIPFYLAHPRLKKLEEKMMLEAEGSTPDECIKLLRHETGHAYFYAYKLEANKKVRKVFGPPSSDETPHNYRPKPYSKSFVRHLDNWYAQAEPEEDFAETFAVWLTPDSDWKNHYKKWPALEKLEYMDQLMKKIAGKNPLRISKDKSYSIRTLKLTLKTYYQRKQKLFAQDYPDFYDKDLQTIFVHEGKESAREFMKRNQKTIISKVSGWTGEKKFIVDNLYKKLMERCQNLKLKVGKNELEVLSEVTAFLTSMTANYLYTGKFKPLV